MQTLFNSICLSLLFILGSCLLLSASTPIVDENAYSHLSTEELRDVQFDILMELYNSTDGPNWTNNTNWGTSAPLGEWYGIEATNGPITYIDLRSNNLTGTIPVSLGDLNALGYLHLSGNNLSGGIPSELGNLTSLIQLGLSGNELTGGIPRALGNLIDLRDLTLQANDLKGDIPITLSNLGNLQHLDLSNNSLTGAIPSELGNLSSLDRLLLGWNSLTGGIPVEIGNLTELTHLTLSGNQLTGDIPGSLGNLTNLIWLSMSDNNLTGGLPTTLGNLLSLKTFQLNGNQLTGAIPATLGNLTKLNYITLADNQLTGGIPASLGNITKLERVFLNLNQLTGTIPSELGNFSFLKTLNLRENSLSGSFPDSFIGYCNSSTTIDALDNLQMTEDDFEIWCNGGSCENISDAGEITYSGFSGFVDEIDPDVITGSIPNVLSAGGSGTIEYQWEEQVEGGSWNEIANATNQDYDPPLITESRCYRRKARMDCETTWLTSNEFCFINCTDENNFSGNTNISREKDCTLIEEALNVDISHFCNENELGAIVLKGIDSADYEIFWNTGKRTAQLNDLYQGTYCVTITSTDQLDCSLTSCYKVQKNEDCESLITTSNQIIINELSNGLGYGGEYIELLVVGDGECGTVDIRGFIIDDNNGDFSIDNNTAGTGIAPGHIRFSHNDILKEVPVGSLLLIYNPYYKNENIALEDDPLDLDKDGVYVIPIDDPILIGNEDSPSIADLTSYAYSPNFELANWNSIWLYDYADALQIRNPDGSYHYGLSYGLDLLMQGGPDDLHVLKANLIDRVISFSGGDFLETTNFLVDFRYNSVETPGAPNNLENQAYITSLCDNITSNEEVAIKEDLAFNIYPNPFQDIFYLEVYSDTQIDTQLELYDILGRRIISQTLALDEGYNKVMLDPSDKAGNGTYFLILRSGNTKLIHHKMICIK